MPNPTPTNLTEHLITLLNGINSSKEYVVVGDLVRLIAACPDKVDNKTSTEYVAY